MKKSVISSNQTAYKLKKKKGKEAVVNMERTMSIEEKIRRAEEIYNRRNGENHQYQNIKQKVKKGPSLMQRMIKQIIICLIVYGMFYIITNRDYYLSQEFKTKMEQMASQNEHTQKAYNWANEQIQKYIKPILKEEKGTENNSRPETENSQTKADETTSQTEEQTQISNEENIGGAIGETREVEKTQEQRDIETIRNTTSFIKPIEGTISSTFGWRTPTTVTVPKYHTGVDISAKTGTKIKSATNGKVILASSEGDYGKHYKIQIDDIILIYAHCSKLYLNEGDDVVQGQEIAEVGSTGNSTRSTFAF